MHKYDRTSWPKRLGGGNATRLVLLLLGFATVMIVMRTGMILSAQRPKFDLMSSERCVPLSPGHLENSFVRRGACFSRRQVQRIITDLVLDSSIVFDTHNLTYFLDSGTLLGSLRNGSVIPHDQDADMGFDVKSLEYIQSHPITFPPKYELHVLNSKYHPQGTRFKGLPAKVVHKESGLYMDIFVYIDTIEKGAKVTGPLPSDCFGGCKSCPRVGPGKWHFQVPYDWIYPLQSCQFGGRTLKCPAQPEKYLEYMYGYDYATPAYDYDS